MLLKIEQVVVIIDKQTTISLFKTLKIRQLVIVVHKGISPGAKVRFTYNNLLVEIDFVFSEPTIAPHTINPIDTQRPKSPKALLLQFLSICRFLHKVVEIHI